MREKTPIYIKELKEDLKNHIDQKIENHVPKYFKEFREHIDKKFDKIDEKLEIHFETIGEIKVQVTEISLNLRNKASHEYVKDIDKRTGKLEKTVFA